MFANNLKPSEKFALICATLAFLLALLMIVDDRLIYRYLVATTKQGAALGKISYQDNDVRRKSDSRFTWMPLGEGDKIYSLDQVFTGTGSNAVLDGADGSQFLIGANSLVTVFEIDNKIALDIGFGDLKLVLKPNSVVYLSKDNKTSAFSAGDKGANVKISSGLGNQIEIKASEGEIVVNDSKNSAQITPNDGVKKITAGNLPNPEEIDISLYGGFYNKTVTPQLLKSQMPKFAWTSSYKFESYQIVFSYDANFSTVFRKESSKKNEFWSNEILKAKKDEKVFWKVQAQLAKDQTSVESRPSYFIFSTNKAPNLLFPTPSLRITSEDVIQNPVQVHFAFEPQTPLKFYEVEVSHSPRFDKITQSLIVKSPPALSEPLSPGSYFWRVKGRTATTGDGDLLVSPTSNFVISSISPKKLKTPLKPQSEPWFELVSKTEGKSHQEISSLVEIRQIAFSDNYPELKATQEEEPTPHEFQISRKSDFSSLAYQYTSSTSHVTWKTPRLGKYFFRVRRIEGSLKSPFSAVSSFGVKLFPPISTTPTSFELPINDLADISLNQMDVPLSWQPTILTDEYELHVSQSPGFTKPQIYFSKSNSINYLAKNTGVYFWKIRSIDEKRIPVSDFSETYSFKFQKEFTDQNKIRAFRQIFPEHSETLFIVGKGANIVRFRWSTPFPLSTKFQVQLSKDSTYSSLILNTVSNFNHLDHKKHIPAGDYFWRIRAKMGDIITDWTPSARFTVVEQKSFDLAKVESLSNLKKINATKGLGDTERSIASGASVTNKISPPAVPNPKSTIFAEVGGLDVRNKSWKSMFEINSTNTTSSEKWPYLQWSSVAAADNYVLEIATDNVFRNLVLRKDLNTTDYTWSKAPLGSFYFRVSASHNQIGISKPSEAVRLVVTQSAPILINPVQRVEWKNAANKNKEHAPFDLVWTPVANAKSYQIELSKNLSFTDKKVLTSTTHRLRLRLEAAGISYARVRALDNYGQPISAFTASYPIDFYVLEQPLMVGGKITPTLPIQNSEVIFPSDDIHNLGFKWLSGVKSNQFTIQISKSTDFARPLHVEKADASEAVVRYGFANGDYYWRVGGVAPDGNLIWSEAQKFTAKVIRKIKADQPATRALSSSP